MTTAQLKSRRDELSEWYEEQLDSDGDEPKSWTRQPAWRLQDIALWRAQLQADAAYIGMQLAFSDEGSEAAEQFLPR